MVQKRKPKIIIEVGKPKAARKYRVYVAEINPKDTKTYESTYCLTVVDYSGDVSAQNIKGLIEGALRKGLG